MSRIPPDKILVEHLSDECHRLSTAYDLFMEHFDLLPDDIKIKLDKQLKEIGTRPFDSPRAVFRIVEMSWKQFYRSLAFLPSFAVYRVY